MVEVLEEEFNTIEEAAEAALQSGFDLYESRAKYTVVGQLFWKPGSGTVHPDDMKASKVALGNYGTEIQARNAALSLAFSTATGEMFRTWPLKVFHGTPAALFADRKDQAKAEALEARNKASVLFKERILWHQNNPHHHWDDSKHIETKETA